MRRNEKKRRAIARKADAAELHVARTAERLGVPRPDAELAAYAGAGDGRRVLSVRALRSGRVRPEQVREAAALLRQSCRGEDWYEARAYALLAGSAQ